MMVWTPVKAVYQWKWKEGSGFKYILETEYTDFATANKEDLRVRGCKEDLRLRGKDEGKDDLGVPE